MAIPHILHQTWKSEVVPEPLARFQARWRALHPDFEYRLWTDAQNDAFVRAEFPELYALYRSFSREIYRADLVRCLYLLRFGGVYVDLDVEPLRPLHGFLAECGECVLGAEPQAHARKRQGKATLACNAIMASAPGHPFWRRMLQEIAQRAALGGDPVGVTGPLALDAAYEKHGRALGVKLMAPDAFFPLPDLDAQTLPLAAGEHKHFRSMRELRLYPSETLGVHHWAHTWIPETGVNRGVQRLLGWSRDGSSVLRGQKTIDELVRPERYKLRFPEAAFPARKGRQARYLAQVEVGRERQAHSSLTIVTLLHNRLDLALYLRARCEAVLKGFRRGRVLVLCDDSTDGTAQVIADWARSRPDLVVNVPAPAAQPGVTGFARMAQLRNALLERLEAEPATDFVAAMDGDLEGPVSLEGLAHSIALLAEPQGPDAVAALGINNWVGLPLLVPFLGYGYYDPIAFREQSWERRLSDVAIRYRLAGLKRGDEPLRVKSAFAGLVLYRAASVRGLRYDAAARDCEHVGFHRALAERGGSLVLNPSLMLLAGRQGHHQKRSA
ncbi:MAG TPA: glycosyltransferase [Polyangiaceae bacterium]|nr:glycosyltransferase [Polyangiaceae bacterium]